jgi:tetratricopeptide (TPR) repeat protein
MRKLLLTGIIVMLMASLALAQAPAGQTAPAGQAAPQQNKKEIKDPAEYNAYMAAVQATDPNQKAASLEGFLNQYPNSVMKTDALEMLMGTYQQSGNVQKIQDTAGKLLQADPKNTPALAVLSFLLKAKIPQEAQSNPTQAQADIQQAQQYAQQGLQALQNPCPEGVAPADCDKRKTQLAAIFNSTLGFTYLQQKNYPQAAQYLEAQVKANPQDLESTYQLALAMLEQKPINPQGLWYGARAVNLAGSNAAAQQQIDKYVKNRYIRYHGDDSGYTEMIAAAANPTPPAGWQVAPAPTPAELAAKLVQSKQVNQMSFDEIQLILTSGNQQAADQVWNAIKDKPIALLGKLINGTSDTLQIAGSADDIEANKADIELKMVGPIPAKMMPANGGDVKFQGNPTSYDPNPFMVHMTEGTLVGAAKAAPSKAPAKSPAKKAPARKKK